MTFEINFNKKGKYSSKKVEEKLVHLCFEEGTFVIEIHSKIAKNQFSNHQKMMLIFYLIRKFIQKFLWVTF